jgi:hypothetical protein
VAQGAHLNWQGRRLWTERGRRMASEGLARALEHGLGVSNSHVPLDEGTLERSGTVVVNGLEGSIIYDTAYARRQHEELTWRHLPGRTAKFLENAMNSESEIMLAIMAAAVRRWARGG